MTHVLHLMKIVEGALSVHVSRGLVRRIDRFSARAWDNPETSILLVGGFYAQPGSKQSVRIGLYVVGILVPTLASAARRVEKERRLGRQHIWADQSLENVEHTRMQQSPFSSRRCAMKHVNACKSGQQFLH